MYRAKSAGKDGSVFFERSMRDAAIARLDLERELRLGIERGDFFLEYQPIIDLITRRASGLEGLVRWRHPGRGILAPGVFMATAEETGLIVPLGRIVLREACRQARAWQDAGWPPLDMCVNISPRQLADPRLFDDVATVLAETELEPRWLTLEITESVIMLDMDRAIATLGRLRALGVRVAVDDFGTGYSSLAYVKDFPLDDLKVDRTFIKSLDEGRDRRAVAETLFRLGRVLELRTIAEGVETTGQLAAVEELGATHAQGFLFSHPLLPEHVRRFLDQRPA